MSYCYYYMQDYKSAATMYEQLVKVCPNVDEYKVSDDSLSKRVRSMVQVRPKTNVPLGGSLKPPMRIIFREQVCLAQSLFKAGMYLEATRAAVRVDSPQYHQRVIALQVRFYSQRL